MSRLFQEPHVAVGSGSHRGCRPRLGRAALNCPATTAVWPLMDVMIRTKGKPTAQLTRVS
jgi:hypothetical protein